MKKGVFSILVLSTLLFVVACSGSAEVSPSPENPLPSPTPVLEQEPVYEVPSYVVPIISRDEAGQYIGHANAVLVDKDEGLFVTNAHVIAEGKMFEVALGKALYPIIEEWVNWEADLAIVKLFDISAMETLNELTEGQDIPIPTLPTPPLLASPPLLLSETTTVGYVIDREKGAVVPYVVKSSLVEKNADWAITEGARLDRAGLKLLLEERGVSEIPEEYQYWFYQNYMVIQQLKEEHFDNTFRVGLSGAAVITEKGEFIGIISGITSSRALVIPATEIEIFVEKVRDNLP